MASIPSDPAAEAARLLAASTFEPRLSVDGLVPGSLVFPERPDEVAALLAECGERGLGVIPVGSGTKLALGNAPERADVAISTTRLRGVLDYVPTDLVVSVAAGSRFGDVQAVLAEHGQTLPVEPPGGDDATIGGMIATALAGPRRLGSGTLRDLLIGMAVAHPSGTVTKSGGMVVKNVTGFDLSRVYHGALGTLGIITSANFRVLPLPRHRLTVVGSFASMHEAIAAARRVRESRVMPIALECIQRSDGWETATLLEGQERILRTLDAEIRGVYGADTVVHDGDASDGWWNGFREHRRLIISGQEAVLRAASRPGASADLAASVAGALANVPLKVTGFSISPGLGTVTVRVHSEGEDAAAHVLVLMAVIGAAADNVTLMAAPPSWKRGVDVWGVVPETLDVMESLKEQFDPLRVLNPGRFAGSI